MRHHHVAALPVLVLLAVLSLAATAFAARNATRSQASAIARAVRSSPVAGIDKVPARHYRVVNVRISTVSSAWAMASLTPTKAARDNFQPAIVLAIEPAGTRSWTVVDLGSAEVGCGIAPNAVLADLLALKSGESPCPPGEGVS
jgi:hypothetical protein